MLFIFFIPVTSTMVGESVGCWSMFYLSFIAQGKQFFFITLPSRIWNRLHNIWEGGREVGFMVKYWFRWKFCRYREFSMTKDMVLSLLRVVTNKVCDLSNPKWKTSWVKYFPHKLILALLVLKSDTLCWSSMVWEISRNVGNDRKCERVDPEIFK